jgi:hypothetical protein
LNATTSKFARGIAAACSAAMVYLWLPATAAAECPAFPQVALWGEYSHDSVRRQVKENLAGDWSAYTGQLQRQLTTLRDIYGRGSGVAVKRQDREVRLTGDALAAYIKFAEQRLVVVKCLADSSTAVSFASFATAAGTPSDLPPDPAAKSAKADKENLQRTYIMLPEDILDKLRKLAVRRSVKEGRQASVGEIVAEILEREFKK